ncbi:EcsC family protein [Limnoraphis robusta CCNP1315]|uniref:EcsC family protein n=2 Tax=Limnoraphis TaxID=1332112 RepID=A0ABU5TUR3_9CYAN|nr:EcsC family protein [Limnoraphis robusta CCNP1315]
MTMEESKKTSSAQSKPETSSKGDLGSCISETLIDFQGVIDSSLGVASQVAQASAIQVQQLFEEAIKGTGNTMAAIAENPVVKIITKFFGGDWLKVILGQVNIEEAEGKVKKLRQKYPHETADQIAHRIMVEKSIQGAGIGLATNFIPPLAAALFAIDLATTTRLQAEMVYEIAAAYGLDLNNPERRGEVLGIFGLSLGGSSALKVGFGVIEVIPGIGAFVGASSNAVMLYALGYAACRFYETKLQPDGAKLTPTEFYKEQEDYFKKAFKQEEIMDQILVHTVLASSPEKSWSDVVSELLQQGNFNSQTADTIENHLKNHQSLESLLQQLHPDFAPSTLMQCYRIAQADGVITAKERKVLEAIAAQFDLNLNEIEENYQTQLSQQASQL